MAIIENGIFPKLTGEDARVFQERAKARESGTNVEELHKIKEGLREALEFLSGPETSKKDRHSG